MLHIYPLQIWFKTACNVYYLFDEIWCYCCTIKFVIFQIELFFATHFEIF